MNLFYQQPAEGISAYVEAIMVMENVGMVTPFWLPLFANGTPTLLFSTAPGLIGTEQHQLILFGQTVAPAEIVFPEDFKLVAYFLKPYALVSLFNIQANELTDRPVDMSLLPGITDLQEQLLNAGTTARIIETIDSFLQDRISLCKGDDKRLIYAAEKIAGNPEKSVLRALQQELYITERTFERQFDRYIGVSPNQFRRINQFSKAFQQINNNQFTDLSTLAHQNNYADQSHFARTFKEFTNITPTQYLQITRDLL